LKSCATALVVATLEHQQCSCGGFWSCSKQRCHSEKPSRRTGLTAYITVRKKKNSASISILAANYMQIKKSHVEQLNNLSIFLQLLKTLGLFVN